MAEGAYAQGAEEEEGEGSSSEDDDMVGPSLGDGRTAVPDAVAYRHLRQKQALATAKAGGGGGGVWLGGLLGWGLVGVGVRVGLGWRCVVLGCVVVVELVVCFGGGCGVVWRFVCLWGLG